MPSSIAVQSSLPSSHAVAALGGKLYAVGGLNDDDGYLSSVERYDPATNACRRRLRR